jgi:tRNA(fMet)-specific endonuclease VapC
LKKYLIDTDISIFFLKGRQNIANHFAKVGVNNCFISQLTVAELNYGAEYSDNPAKHHQKNKDYFRFIQILPIDTATDFFGKEKARLRRQGLLIPDFDLMIGASAVVNNYIMVTNNEAHLSRIDGIQIENWMKM